MSEELVILTRKMVGIEEFKDTLYQYMPTHIHT